MGQTYYPIFNGDVAAKCFRCGRKLENHRDSGYPKGRGPRVADCSTCKMSTWYDLKPPVPMMSRG